MRTAWIERGRAIVSAFLSWEEFSYFCAGRREDCFNNRDRAERCHEALEHGLDGSTHAERIDDMRRFWNEHVRLRRRSAWREYDRTTAAVDAYLDAVEQFHETNGTLHLEAI